MEHPYLLISVGGDIVALPVRRVREIAHLPRLASALASAPAVAGVMNLRGDAVPVLRLSRLLKLEDAAAWAFQVVVIVADQPLWALLADRAEAIIQAQPHPWPSGLGVDDCVEAAVDYGGVQIPVLAVERLFGRHEAAAMEAFRSRAHERLREFGIEYD